ncbi:apelin isoform X1 [Gasterosteus aculeatus]
MASWSHGLHGAWQRAGRGSHREENRPTKPRAGRSDPQTSRLEEETPTATSLPQGAHAVLEQGTALSALPKVLISKLFLCLGGPCNDGPTFAQPEE